MAAGHEPFLELELPGGGPNPRTQPVVGRGQQSQLEPDCSPEPLGHRREWLAATQRLGADEMESQVAVAELEPGLAAQQPDRFARVPGLTRTPPAALVVTEPAEGVEQRVEVGRDVEAVHLEVVADVGDHGHVAGLDDLRQRLHEAGAADAACQDGELHLAPERRLASAARVFEPTRGSSRSRSSSVSTSSVRFGISTNLDGASARKRAALPGP